MIALKKQEASTGQGATVIPFPNSYDGTSNRYPVSIKNIMEELVTDPAFEDKIKSIVEGYVIDLWLKSIKPDLSVDDPFDSIYLADLLPDILLPSTIQELETLKNINDLSNTITFNDDWDD